MGGKLASRLRLSCVGAILLALPFAVDVAASDAALPPYEPNDSIAQAWGPLLAGQGYQADLQPADRDYYYFYVTADNAPPAELSLLNMGGGTQESTIDLSVVDGLGTPIASQAFIRHAEARALSAPLAPGKYYVEVTSNQGYGDTYALSAGSAKGSFGPYAPIAARCAAAQTGLAEARRALSKAKGRYQRAVARRRRSRYAGPRARRRARRAQAKARSNLALARSRLRAANAALLPWCSIPQ
jgi:hypothetical protein